jgi:hypothetical protein
MADSTKVIDAINNITVGDVKGFFGTIKVKADSVVIEIREKVEQEKFDNKIERAITLKARDAAFDYAWNQYGNYVITGGIVLPLLIIVIVWRNQIFKHLKEGYDEFTKK